MHFVRQFAFSLVAVCVSLMCEDCLEPGDKRRAVFTFSAEKVRALLAAETRAAVCLWAFYSLLCEYFYSHKLHFL